MAIVFAKEITSSRSFPSMTSGSVRHQAVLCYEIDLTEYVLKNGPITDGQLILFEKFPSEVMMQPSQIYVESPITTDDEVGGIQIGLFDTTNTEDFISYDTSLDKDNIEGDINFISKSAVLNAARDFYVGVRFTADALTPEGTVTGGIFRLFFPVVNIAAYNKGSVA